MYLGYGHTDVRRASSRAAASPLPDAACDLSHMLDSKTHDVPSAFLDNAESSAPKAHCDFSVLSCAFPVLESLESEGFEAWIVGGSVRDALTGLPCADIDIASNAPWTDVARIFKQQGCPVYETGVKHGTLTVSVAGRLYEITTFRSDGPYADNRRPSSVCFVSSLREDLARRDFTMNALAYHPVRGLVDIYGGAQDIRRRMIVAVGDPSRRFEEDALRIVRACRFAAQLGFSLETETFEAMKVHKSLLSNISAERIAHELDRFVVSAYAGKAILDTIDVLDAVLPELGAAKGLDQKTPYHCYDVLTHIARAVDFAPRDRLIRWATMLHDIGKPVTFFTDENGRGHFYGHGDAGADIAALIMRRLRMPIAFARNVEALVRYHDCEVAPTKRSVRKMIAKLGSEKLFRPLCDVRIADCLAHAPEHQGGAASARKTLRVFEQMQKDQDAFGIRDLAIDGTAVMACGAPQGPLVGQALAAVFEAVTDERIENNAYALEEFVRAWLEEHAQLSMRH